MISLRIANDNQDIISSNFWESGWNGAGIFACSINAGAFRLLVPDPRRADINEMQTGEEIIISKGTLLGRLGYEFLFDDHTDDPYSIHLGENQFIGVIPANTEHGKAVMCSAWVRGPEKVLEMPARFRVVKKLPYLKPWGE
jgi:hypothetical protein